MIPSARWRRQGSGRDLCRPLEWTRGIALGARQRRQKGSQAERSGAGSAFGLDVAEGAAGDELDDGVADCVADVVGDACAVAVDHGDALARGVPVGLVVGVAVPGCAVVAVGIGVAVAVAGEGAGLELGVTVGTMRRPNSYRAGPNASGTVNACSDMPDTA